MGALRHEISLLVFNSITQVEHEKRNSISTSNHVLFCSSYKHNSTPHGKVELINENRRIDNPRLKIVKCVDA